MGGLSPCALPRYAELLPGYPVRVFWKIPQFGVLCTIIIGAAIIFIAIRYTVAIVDVSPLKSDF